MSKKLPTIWPAEPHTLAKIAILRNYLNAWTPILASRFESALTYIDGYAGAGRYSGGEEGSPLAAIGAIDSALKRLGDQAKCPQVNLHFVESDRLRHKNLLSEFSHLEDLHPKVCVHDPIRADFCEAMREVELYDPEAFGTAAPLFLFVDPFGLNGMSFEVLKRLVRGRSAELLINLDADGIRRVYQASNKNREDQLTSYFGCDAWKAFDHYRHDHRRLHQEILALYQRQLLKEAVMQFVWPFSMRSQNDSLSYYLVFASKSFLGMEKMKESMRAIAQDGAYSFSDAAVDQEHLMFDHGELETFSSVLWERFKHKRVDWPTVTTFTLNDTPFTNPKKMLERLERQDRLAVDAPQRKRRYTFPDGEVRSLEFIDPPPPAPRAAEQGEMQF